MCELLLKGTEETERSAGRTGCDPYEQLQQNLCRKVRSTQSL